ncbi:UDP-N-acetylmuramoyl-tripeptide--D-alanyl-D-alanine ligase [Promicromonospora iranensis]|uniref:UDP-N-acetylmuramoyl-tripeptide--D-alanyl-D-alanine ligase n=1 Tax=Promicromonospora iranensis TaxID=1105144 RepID=A0ABU2CJ71_9MICO|nr:UDP-N-acetylmuramoyl-tripeptide--D-alanyl-D-alanine ligase [Promicromonospora iranensis]MDR7381385.1 UDP-N-acetylmuramoyl-tripeptide--D-alanyl-D-alanine ligase [Promicromonospora iranensis]
MIELTAAQVAAATGGRLHADPDVTVTGAVITDSRDAGPGALFVALPGERVDGHDFAATAVAAGAALVLASRELDGLPTVVVDDPQTALGELARYVLATVRSGADGDVVPQVVAVTGSVGKTTTKDLLGQLLTPEAGNEHAIIVPKGSFNNEIGLPLTVLRVTAATRYLVLEMGADRVGNIAYLTRIAPPDVGVVLAVGVAHVGHFGSIEAIAQTKGEMVEGVVDGGSVVLNADDLRVVAMANRAAPGTTVQTFGTIPSADVRAEDVTVDPMGRASFTLRVARTGEADEQRADVALQLVGAHHVSNALAAATVALRLGVPVPDVAKRLSEATALSPHRMAVTERPDGVTVIDDAYNANPDSMKAALRTLAVVSGRTRRSVAVLGEMLELGDGARAAHDEIGRLVVRLNIKQLVVVGEGAYHIHEGAMQEGSWGSESIFVPDIAAARSMLDESLEPGDVVLVKSSLGAGLTELGDHLSMARTVEDNNK